MGAEGKLRTHTAIDLALAEFGATVEHLQGGVWAAPSPHLRILEESHGSLGCQGSSFFPGSQAFPGLWRFLGCVHTERTAGALPPLPLS